MKKVKIDSMAAEIVSEMQKHAKTSSADVKKAVRRVANRTKKQIAENSPENTGKYEKGWGISVYEEKVTSLVMVISNKKPGLPHLLENGHAKRNGGRVPGMAHIAPAEEQAKEELIREIEKVLK